MKLLLDQNLSPSICDYLAGFGIQSLHVRDVGLRDASDEEILGYARREELVVVSQDSDFTNLLVWQNTSRPSLILLRLPNAVAAADIAEVLAANLGAISDHLRSGAIVSLNSERIRVRRLPLG
ncbi:DUF5615 family PIN-like protein [Propionimicrobium sp. PCR01-08-3]|uniref:DUF5615 family PIN-like protein n=1 Tax=Propionimicrobium sp. PCR01-08-3 TaxID=3052086 RepID=UPI0033413000